MMVRENMESGMLSFVFHELVHRVPLGEAQYQVEKEALPDRRS